MTSNNNLVGRSESDGTATPRGNDVGAIVRRKTRRRRRWQQLIRVVYPTDGGRIALRTEENWDTNVNAHSTAADGCVSEFQMETERPYFYFKPVLLRNGTMLWSRKDFLGVATSGAPLEIYPYFREDAHFSVSDLMPPLAGPSGAEHRFRVFVPPSYDENTLKKYPVLYMHDGHNLFFKEEAFAGKTWRTDEVIAMLDNMNATEGVIVVGIYPHDREREYTFPGYEDYGHFLVETLKPVIDTNYRTLAGPETTAVMGSSLGGVVSFYLAWQWPQVFGKVACLSSTFTRHDDLLERISAEPKRAIRIYLDSGWPGDNYEATRSMRDRLIWKGYRPGSELFYLAFPEAQHDESAWAARSPIPFQFLFGKLPVFSRRSHPRGRFIFPAVPNPMRGV
jgi:predicted alpha/beta superfamily hydrolase